MNLFIIIGDVQKKRECFIFCTLKEKVKYNQQDGKIDKKNLRKKREKYWKWDLQKLAVYIWYLGQGVNKPLEEETNAGWGG